MKYLILILLASCASNDYTPPTNNNPAPAVKSWSLQYNQAIAYRNVEYCIYDLYNYTKVELDKANCKKIAYFSLHWEDWRADIVPLKDCTTGKLGGWAGERVISLNKSGCYDRWKKVMSERVKLAKAKGFMGVDPDNLDQFSSEADQIRAFNYVKSLGLKITQKNSTNLVGKIDPDFYMLEQCQEYNECSVYYNGKPIFDIEYNNKYCKPFKGVYIVQKDIDDMGRERKLCQ